MGEGKQQSGVIPEFAQKMSGVQAEIFWVPVCPAGNRDDGCCEGLPA